MTTLLAQIAPQRSTQYAALATHLAPLEMELCPFIEHVSDITCVQLGGQDYVKIQLADEPSKAHIQELGLLATGSGYFLYYDELADVKGPFLHPLETNFLSNFPTDLISARRYQGKTNELLTHFMCNVARFSSAFSNESWENLRIFDPLAGGGTTLFVGLILGAEVCGVELNKKSAHSTAVFFKQYLQEKEIVFDFKEEQFKKQNSSRWWFTFDDFSTRCILAKGDIAQSADLVSCMKKPHFIITDLPYGVQHKGGLHELLEEALPVWHDILLAGGSLVFSWEATRFSRELMVDLVESVSDFKVLEHSPFDQFEHRVDRVIKRCDILAATVSKE